MVGGVYHRNIFIRLFLKLYSNTAIPPRVILFEYLRTFSAHARNNYPKRLVYDNIFKISFDAIFFTGSGIHCSLVDTVENCFILYVIVILNIV